MTFDTAETKPETETETNTTAAETDDAPQTDSTRGFDNDVTPEELDILKERKEMTPQLLKKMINLVKQRLQSKLRNVNPSYVWVLFVGVTGSGKTSLLYELAGKTLVGVEDEESGLLILKAKEKLTDEDGEIKIGHSATSETFLPNIFVDDTNQLVLIDCPGFLDTTKSWRLINSFIFHFVLSSATNVKMELVVSQSDLIGKAVETRQSLELISQILPDETERKKALGIVMSKSSRRAKPVGFLKRLSEGETGESRKMLDFFVNEGKGRVFSFPEAEDEGDYTLFTSKDQLIADLKNDPAVHPKHGICIDDQTQLLVAGMASQIIEEKCAIVNSFIDVLMDFAIGLERKQDVEKWMILNNELKDAFKQEWVVFATACRLACQENSDLIQPTQKIVDSTEWEQFMKMVTDQNPVTKQLVEQFNSPMKVMEKRFDNVSKVLKIRKHAITGRITWDMAADLQQAVREHDLQLVLFIAAMIPFIVAHGLLMVGAVLCNAVVDAAEFVLSIPKKIAEGIAGLVCSACSSVKNVVCGIFSSIFS